METTPSIAMEAEKDDLLLLLDIRAGYIDFCLHFDIRYFFLIHFAGRFYRFIGLQFG